MPHGHTVPLLIHQGEVIFVLWVALTHVSQELTIIYTNIQSK